MDTHDPSGGDEPLSDFVGGLTTTFKDIFGCSDVRGTASTDDPFSTVITQRYSYQSSAGGTGGPSPPAQNNETIPYNHSFLINRDRHNHDIHSIESLLAAIHHNEDAIRILKQHNATHKIAIGKAKAQDHGHSVKAALRLIQEDNEKIKRHEKQLVELREKLHEKRLAAQEHDENARIAATLTIVHGSQMDLARAKKQVAVFAGSSFKSNSSTGGSFKSNSSTGHHRPPTTANVDAAHHHHHHHHHHPST